MFVLQHLHYIGFWQVYGDKNKKNNDNPYQLEGEGSTLSVFQSKNLLSYYLHQEINHWEPSCPRQRMDIVIWVS